MCRFDQGPNSPVRGSIPTVSITFNWSWSPLLPVPPWGSRPPNIIGFPAFSWSRSLSFFTITWSRSLPIIAGLSFSWSRTGSSSSGVRSSVTWPASGASTLIAASVLSSDITVLSVFSAFTMRFLTVIFVVVIPVEKCRKKNADTILKKVQWNGMQATQPQWGQSFYYF